MTERLLQFIWQFQYFNKNNLHTIDGECLEVILPGQYNHNQGPDFFNGRIRIGDTILVGNIELHLIEADWHRHEHQHDPNYNNIILHVLWESPKHIRLSLPTVALRDRVSKILLERYRELMRCQAFVPCANNIHEPAGLTWIGWKERLIAERMSRKSMVIQQHLHQSHHHWEEVFWWMLARNFGIPVNAEAFEGVARSLPLNTIARHKNHLPHLEALLLGQAGLLNECEGETYAAMLAREYQFFKRKYALIPIHLPVHFLRMRPHNFPTVRLAQLAVLMHTLHFPFCSVKECRSLKELRELLQVTAGEFWDTHFMLHEITAFKKKSVGQQMIENIIINTIAPMLFAYGQLKQEQQYKDKALEWLSQLPSEKNVVTAQWEAMGIINQHASDSQALLELKKEYCDARRCLECAVGNYLLRESCVYGEATVD